MGQKSLFLIFITILVLLVFSPFLLIKIKPKNQVPPPSISLIRKPVVAGSFYPNNQQELDKTISGLIDQTESIPVVGKPRILIVPHAGINFSGQTAAWGFRQIEKKDISQIILLGPSHYNLLDHTAVFSRGTWETPLGNIDVDEVLAKSLLDENKKIIADEAPYVQEHSLEMELIFLQKVLKNFKIVPILLGQPDDQLIDDLAKKISQNFDERTLLVVSTDLSHYPIWEIANEVDEQTIDAILTGKKDKLEETIKTMEAKKYPNLDTPACGYSALRVTLKVGEILQIKDFKKIKYENSGDVSGDKTRVVGYVSVIASSEEIPSSTPQLDVPAQKEALLLARKTLEEHLNNKQVSSFLAQNQIFNQPLGVFVTLRKKGELRGCIGEFEPSQPLYKVIQNTAIAAATEDPRFSPVKSDELKEIKIEISVMSPKRKINDWQKIKLGKDGVVVQEGFKSGTFLPQVATETGWNLEKFLAELCSQKAGLPPKCYQDPTVTLYTFEAQIFGEE